MHTLSPRRKAYDRTLRTLLYICAGITCALLVFIIGYIFYRGLGNVSWELLSSETSYINDIIGILPNILNTLYIIFLAMIIVLPLGVGAAIYLTEYASNKKVVAIIEFATETLTGIPSIIFGLVGMLFFLQLFGLKAGILAGGLTLVIMILPTIVRTTQESFKTVPQSYRDRPHRGRVRGPAVHRRVWPGPERLHYLPPVLLCHTDGSPLCLRQRTGRDGRCLCHRRGADDPGAHHQLRRLPGRQETEKKGPLIMADDIITVKSLNLWYGTDGKTSAANRGHHALKDINVDIPVHQITALIGPSGCGKSTFLKTLNRMNDLVPGVHIEGDVCFEGQNIFDKNLDITWLRKQIGMVFQKANPFPMSIYDNVAYGPRTHGIRNRTDLDAIVEKSLRDAAIWDEVKDRLKKSALGLSGGQQQRLCIARALANEPEVLLMDESTSALDPISTSKIEDLAVELKEKYTVIMVTHNMQQAARVSDKTAFFLLGELVEFGDTEKIFSTPTDKRTEEYITGRFG